MNHPLKTVPAVTTTNDLDYPTWQRGGNAFATLVARLCLSKLARWANTALQT